MWTPHSGQGQSVGQGPSAYKEMSSMGLLAAAGLILTPNAPYEAPTRL
jgi:hypothetical protein